MTKRSTKQKTGGLPSCQDLYNLLDIRITHPDRAKQIDKQIVKEFQKTRSIFVLDMSGFSRLVQRYGIIHYLAMIQRMRQVVGPAVERFGGMVVKFEADNCFAVFNNPDKALEAALAIHHDLEIANLATENDSDVYVSIGIGHGPVLLFCEDMYGNELNLASKLGEDVAERNEILLTEAAKRGLKGKNKGSFAPMPLTVSGVNMRAWKWKEK
ncbi:MAG TPA: adenylate/guanylate cyclase domain-containing protein [Verrucomicrobiae bacterium]|nr:adenylate/guanylate cyclase domain-containing protein [Verrucomicrobiae bacterium]